MKHYLPFFALFTILSGIPAGFGANTPLLIESGRIKGPKLTYRGLDITGITAELETEGNHFLMRNVLGDFYGGKVRGNFNFVKHSLYFKLNISDAKLQQVPKGIISNNPLVGRLDGEITLAQEPHKGVTPPQGKRRAVKTTGRGKFTVQEGDLGTLPVMVAIQDVLSLPFQQKRRIHGMRGEFAFEDEGVRFSSLDLYGNDVELKGQGFISYKGDLALTFRVKAEPKLFKLIDIPLISDILRETTSGIGAIIPVSVVGTIESPKPVVGGINTSGKKDDTNEKRSENKRENRKAN